MSKPYTQHKNPTITDCLHIKGSLHQTPTPTNNEQVPQVLKTVVNLSSV